MRITFFTVFALLLCVGVGINMALAANNKVSICHTTSSKTNPVVIISVSENAVPAHLKHGDTLLGADGTCHVPTAFVCTGELPTNAVPYSGDNTALTEDTPFVFSETNTPAKCEYFIVSPV